MWRKSGENTAPLRFAQTIRVAWYGMTGTVAPEDGARAYTRRMVYQTQTAHVTVRRRRPMSQHNQAHTPHPTAQQSAYIPH